MVRKKNKKHIPQMDVSENSGFSPQIIHFNRIFHHFHHPFWDTPIFGNPQMVVLLTSRIPSPLPGLMTDPATAGASFFFKERRCSTATKPSRKASSGTGNTQCNETTQMDGGPVRNGPLRIWPNYKDNI